MTILPMYAFIVLGYENHAGPAERTQSKYLVFFFFSGFFFFLLFFFLVSLWVGCCLNLGSSGGWVCFTSAMHLLFTSQGWRYLAVSLYGGRQKAAMKLNRDSKQEGGKKIDSHDWRTRMGRWGPNFQRKNSAQERSGSP